MQRIALIGFGGLGRLAAAGFARDPAIEVVAVAARPRQAEGVRAVLGDVPLVADAQALLATRPQLVVACASHEAFHAYAEPVLRAGIDRKSTRLNSSH